MSLTDSEISILKIFNEYTYKRYINGNQAKLTFYELKSLVIGSQDCLLMILVSLKAKGLITGYDFGEGRSGYYITIKGHQLIFYILSNEKRKVLKH